MVMLDASNAQSESDFQGRSNTPDPGTYHVAVNACAEKASKVQGTPGVEIEFVVIAEGLAADGKSTTSGQNGRTINAFFSFVGKDDDATQRCHSNLTRLALATGVMKPGQKVEPNWEDATGRELVIRVKQKRKEETIDGQKKWVETGYNEVDWFGFWSLGNKEVANVPKDMNSPGMKQYLKGPQASGNGNGNGHAAAATAAAGGNGAKRSSFADL